MNVIYGHPTVESHIAGILEDGKFLCCDNTCILGCFRKQLVPLFNITAHNQAAAVFIQLIEVVGHLLAVGLDGEIGLAQSDHFFARIAVLHD